MDGAARRGLGPLLGGVALAVVVGGVAMAVALHGQQPATRPSPTPTTGASSPPPTRPGATPSGAAPVTTSSTAAWDSTHQVLVAYTPNGGTFAGKVSIWNGGWGTVPTPGDAPRDAGLLVDMPSRHGVALITVPFRDVRQGGTSPVWLFDGARWLHLDSVTFRPCTGPISLVWDQVHAEIVMVVGDACAGTTVQPSRTLTYDGQAWTDHGDAPEGVRWPALAWDPAVQAVVMLQPPGLEDPAAGDREWSWSGAGWTAMGTTGAALAPVQLAGAAWDAAAGGVVALPNAAGPPLGYVVKQGTWSVLHAATYPARIVAVIADTTHRRILVLSRSPVPVDSAPNPAATAFFVLTWDGRAWVRA